MKCIIHRVRSMKWIWNRQSALGEFLGWLNFSETVMAYLPKFIVCFYVLRFLCNCWVTRSQWIEISPMAFMAPFSSPMVYSIARVTIWDLHCWLRYRVCHWPQNVAHVKTSYFSLLLCPLFNTIANLMGEPIFEIHRIVFWFQVE